jgi:hypothetical protein
MGPDQPIRDYVLPLIEARKNGEVFEFKRFHGTCFLIGAEGYALTNAHVLGAEKENVLGVLNIPNDEWSFHEVTESETHPTEDVALLHIPTVSYPSFMKISSASEYSSFPYMQWSYPENVVGELEEDGHIQNRPDLVYLQGYIRRRMTDILIPGINSKSLYELSGAGSLGCSGSPVLATTSTQPWRVVGIFVGEKQTKLDNGYAAVGYAVRSDAIYDWVPKILGKKISSL